MTDTILAETVGSVHVLTLNRPDKLNAATFEMQCQLFDELQAIASDGDIRALVIAGAGRAFCAGGDLDLLRQIMDGTFASRPELARVAKGAFRVMLELEIPAIAAVNGFAVGFGAGLAALCDVVVMGNSSFLSDPHVRHGTAASPVLELLWPHQCSGLLARELLFTGRRVPAEEAMRIGLCNRICDDGEERATALRIAEELASLPRDGIAATKRGLNDPLLAEAVRRSLIDP